MQLSPPRSFPRRANTSYGTLPKSGTGRSRTSDAQGFNLPLYQLSYSPISNSPDRFRTDVPWLKTRCPDPLDDRAKFVVERDGIRTRDLLSANQALFQLSYAPIRCAL